MKEAEMELNSMRNQKGEVIIGAMAVICVVMMLFGGSHMMHGGWDHRHGDDHDKIEHKRDHQEQGKHHQNHDHADQDEEKG
jgi:hypothetical protein